MPEVPDVFSCSVAVVPSMPNAYFNVPDILDINLCEPELEFRFTQAERVMADEGFKEAEVPRFT